MARQFFVGGNFKMNPGSVEQKKNIIDILNQADLDPSTEVVIAPPALYLIPLKGLVRKEIQLAAQNCYFKTSGAFTGEISPTQLVDAGIPYVILGTFLPPAAPRYAKTYSIPSGHSERRTLFHETSEFVGNKTKAALDASLKVILCVGETLAEREARKTTEVVNAQLQAVVDILKDTAYWRYVLPDVPGSTRTQVPLCSNIVIAYEPVWAIGTGKVATAVQAQDAHAEIRQFLKTRVSESVAETTRVIYGGSVTAANCKELATQPDVDGFLVGGASLKPEFVNIINAMKQ
ncbi:Triosephosphate isomerase [Boletus reticuloceps]|uniref:Triosephosphate isomerase n=1 Tax=Boletus reticuloceps TaxID=495285 RepID=A0A8I2YDT8_9AGAM|nr:Triosephosphate isomerase [Boletus reticuloceps]